MGYGLGGGGTILRIRQLLNYPHAAADGNPPHRGTQTNLKHKISFFYLLSHASTVATVSFLRFTKQSYILGDFLQPWFVRWVTLVNSRQWFH